MGLQGAPSADNEKGWFKNECVLKWKWWNIFGKRNILNIYSNVLEEMGA